jgi:RNA polymerase sigma-70 factor, ECF subfamily
MNEPEFRAAFAEHRDAVFQFAWRITNSAATAEDIAQDVFLTLLRQPGRFDPARGRLRPFLLAIARNLARKQWREDSRWDLLEDDQFSAEPLDITGAETAAIVGRAVAALSPAQREVLVLAEYEGMSLEEIARIVDAEVGSVKARLHRARETLRRLLAPLKPVNGRSPHGTIE